MAEFPSLPLFTDSLIADTGHLDDSEFGRYMRLLIITWRTPECLIPNDQSWICKRLNISPLEYGEKVKPLILEFFRPCQNDAKLMQKRLLKEYHYLRGRRERGKAGAAGRWGNTENIEENVSPSICLSDAPHPTPPHPTKADADDRSGTIFQLGERIAEVVGWKNDPRWFGDYSRLGAWLASGCDFDIDILPTIKKVMSKKKGDRPKSLAYFESAVADVYATRTAPMQKGTPQHAAQPQRGNKSERARAAALRGLEIDIGFGSKS